MSGGKIGVIDYKAGNAPSVLNALLAQDIPAEPVRTVSEMEAARALILPGVGSAAATMDSLRELNLVDGLSQLVNRENKPFLGICIGLQALFDYSEEGHTPCLGWIPGTVKRFEGGLRVPQMGWNQVDFRYDDPLLAGLDTSAYFYFVNSYYAVPSDDADVFATAEYGCRFCAMVRRGTIAATQFHVEKSGAAGLRLLANFAGLYA